MDVSVAEKEVDLKSVWRISLELRRSEGAVYQVSGMLSLTLFSGMWVWAELSALSSGAREHYG